MELHEIRTSCSRDREIIWHRDDTIEYFGLSQRDVHKLLSPREFCYRTLPYGLYPTIPHGEIYITDHGFDLLKEYVEKTKIFVALSDRETVKVENEKNKETKKEVMPKKKEITTKIGVQIFSNPAFGDVRTLVINNEPYFVGKDVAAILGYSNPTKAIRDHVDEDDRVITQLSDIQEGSISVPHHMKGSTIGLVNESGIYSLIFGSSLKTAKSFKKWVTSEVLPAIRKTGGYISTTSTDTAEEIMARALIVANETLDRYRKEKERLAEMVLEKEELLEEKKELIERKNEKISKDAPKVEYYEEVLQTEGVFSTTTIAFELGMSALALNKKLLNMNIQYKNGDKVWILKAPYKDKGYTGTKTYMYEKDEKKYTVIHTYWTEKGREFIHRLFKK